MKELKRHLDQIKALCDTNKVKSLFAFDFQQSIDEIFLFLGEDRNFITYQQDLKTKVLVNGI